MTGLILASLIAFQQERTFDPGATFRLYEIGVPIDAMPELVRNQTPNVDRRIVEIDFADDDFWGTVAGERQLFADLFYCEVFGETYAPEDGDYAFELLSDDGSMLYVAGKSIIDNGGIHAEVAKTATLALTEGWHTFRVTFFEKSGGARLRLKWMPPGTEDFSRIPERAMRTEAGVTRVVSPGPKSIWVPGGPLRPGGGAPLDALHPGWDVTTVRPPGFEPKVGGLAFLPDGTLLVATFEPNQTGQFQPDARDGKVWALTGVDGDPSKIRYRQVANLLKYPLGLLVRPEGVYVSEQHQVTLLQDSDGDGTYDRREVACKGWGYDNYHHFTFGLKEAGGWIYGSLSTNIDGDAPGINGPNPYGRGSTFRFRPGVGRTPEYLTSGHRTPNGITVVGEEVFVADNQGSWLPANKLNHIRRGAFFGHYNNTSFVTEAYPQGGLPGLFDDRPFQPPALYLPQNSCANSPSEGVEIPSGPFAGQIILADVTYGGLKRCFLEEVEGVFQGSVMRFTQGLEAGVNRLVWGPDGALYAGMIGAGGNWGWVPPGAGSIAQFGLQRLKPNGRNVFEIDRVSATNVGLEVRFTKPAAREMLANPDSYYIAQWYYRPTVEYGGVPQGREELKVEKVLPSLDGMGAKLVIPGLEEQRVVYLRSEMKGSRDERIWSSEAWYTLNRIPGRQRPLSVLVYSRTAGFRHGSIEPGTEALRSLAASKGWKLDHTEDPERFTPSVLQGYDVVLFLNTTQDVLDDAGEKALEGFVRGGGGFVGIHAASDTEYEWSWYGSLVGAYFKSHPAIQQARVIKECAECPETAHLPDVWVRTDEWYDFRELPKGVHVLMSLDQSSYEGSTMGDEHPIVWRHEFDGGRSWYCGMGHTPESYRDPAFMKLIENGILWVAGKLTIH